MFGDWNRDKIMDSYNGEPDWHPVKDRLFWSIKLDDVLIDGESLGLCNDVDCLFTPDTGTSLLTFPKVEMKAFEEAHPEWTEGANTACDSEHNFGDLTYKINGIEYPIPSSHWIERVPDSDGTSTCKHTIGTLDVGQPNLEHLFIGGDVFMQIYYTIFDREEYVGYPDGRVGLAKANHTAPEIITRWDSSGSYVEEEYACEESFIDPEICASYDHNA